MNKNLVLFLVSLVLAFAGSYLFYHQKAPSTEAVQQADGGSAETAKASPPKAEAEGATTTANAEGEIFTKAGCITCHSVSALNVKGGATGPDLSKAYIEVKDKHGVPIEEFLKKPTSAVMSGVIGNKPLTDEERKQILAALKAASEK